MRWFDRLKERDPRLHGELNERLRRETRSPGDIATESTQAPSSEMVLETIVREGQPALLIQKGKIVLPADGDVSAREITDRRKDNAAKIEPIFPLVGRIDVSNFAGGATSKGWMTHDCTTLGGNSGSAVLDLKTGRAVGLHIAGLYMIENYAVPARHGFATA